MKIAILGAGNMGSAIACGLVRSGKFQAEEIVCTARTEATLERLRTQCPGVRTTTDNAAAVRDAAVVMLAVKPWLTEALIREIRREIDPDRQSVVSVAAGVSLAQLAEWIKLGVKDYILKPVDPSEFSSTITGVITELDEEHKKDEDYNRQANFIKQYYMYTLLNSGDASGILDNGDFLAGYNRLALIEFNTDFFGKYDTGEDIFKEVTGELDYQYLNLNPLQSVIIFSDKSFTADGNIDKNIEEMFTNIHDYIYRKTGQFMYIAVSGLFNDYHELPQVMDAVDTLMNNKFYETGRYIFSDNVSEDTPVLVQIDDDALMKQMKQDIKMKDITFLRIHFDALCKKYRGQSNFSHIYIKFVFSNLLKDFYDNIPGADEAEFGREIDRLYKSEDFSCIMDIVNNNIDLLEKSFGKEQPRHTGRLRQ